MQIVIDIPEDDYENIENTVMSIDEMNNTLEGRVYTSVIRGTVLPKHGRFIDADAMTKDYDTFQKSMVLNKTENGSIVGIVCVAPTVLEADKESAE